MTYKVEFVISDEDKNQLEVYQWNMSQISAAMSFALLKTYSNEQVSETDYLYECYVYDFDGKILSDCWCSYWSSGLNRLRERYNHYFDKMILKYEGDISDLAEQVRQKKKVKRVILKWKELFEHLNTIQDNKEVDMEVA